MNWLNKDAGVTNKAQIIMLALICLILLLWITQSTTNQLLLCNKQYLGQCQTINMRNLAEKVCMSTNKKFHSYNITNYLVKNINCVERE